MNNNPIGMFDSGIGGTTVLSETVKELPHEDFIYISDSKNNPYGDKSEEELFSICDNITQQLLDRDCKAMVIACNTASCREADKLRNKYKDLPIVAIEPAYKMVSDYAKDKPTLIMATKGTIDSEKFNQLYDKYNNNQTLLMPCPGLADMIEKNDIKAVREYLKLHLSPYEGIIKNVVLGCTHYPLIKDEISEVLGNVEYFYGAPNLAKHLRDVLTQKDLLSGLRREGIIKVIDSSESSYKKQMILDYLDRKRY